ncbi:hypothetical protein ACFB49_42370 [Sphingomonas sp. DBB INV C78]|uniref:PEPxxWA-CTERM sorting domain-containing protein n=1 Tax=Sphingomonas sp. DBB INV C78 TaxID=3349434 RepID=UPI0036D2A464
MRMALGAMAFVVAMWTGAAQATVKITLVADLTYTWNDAYQPPDQQVPEISHLGPSQMTLRAESWNSRFFLEGPSAPFGPAYACAAIESPSWLGDGCLAPTYSGNKLSFSAPELWGFYQGMGIDLIFDQVIEGNPDLIASSKLLSGGFSWHYGHHNGSASLQGPVLGMFVPEPASWAMMIAGFGLIGAALRRTSTAPEKHAPA